MKKICVFSILLICCSLVGCSSESTDNHENAKETATVLKRGTVTPTEKEISKEAKMCQGTWISYAANKPMSSCSCIQIDGEQVYEYFINSDNPEKTITPRKITTEFRTEEEYVYIKMYDPYIDDTDTDADADEYILLKDESSDLFLTQLSSFSGITAIMNGYGYKKISDEIIEIHPNQTPYVGMNKGDLIFSTWGSPEDKNITRTTTNIVEQWCYPNYKYIYLENDIITMIQE